MSTPGQHAFLYAALPAPMPAGLRALPLPGEAGLLRACAIIDSKSLKPLPLRDTIDARVFLGALIDARGDVRRWLEIACQDVASPAVRFGTALDVLTNPAADARWARRAARQGRIGALGHLPTGREERHADGPISPIVIDPALGECRLLADWALCTDDKLLAARDLAPYGSSLHRYLCKPADEAASVLVALDPQAPRDARTQEPDALGKGLTLLAPALLTITEHAPISLEHYADALAALPGQRGGKSPLEAMLAGVGRDESAANAGPPGGPLAAATAQAFISRRGTSGVMLEVLHHKLAAFADALTQVRECVQASNEPMLSLSAASFRVVPGAASSALPALWGARAVLVDPGAGVALPVPSTTHRLFVNLSNAGPSVYRAASSAAATGSSGGTGILRVRRVLSEGAGLVVEGTLTTQERLVGSSRDCVWMRFTLQTGRVDLLAMVEPKSALAAGEVRLRSLPHDLPGEVAEAIKSIEGLQLHDVAFELAPMVSTPADLYSMAVTACRLLLVDARSTLPVALDELHSLARQIAVERDGAGASAPLAGLISNILSADDRFAEALGPQRLTAQGLSFAQATSAVPLEIWSAVLAMLVRGLPGIGPDSLCKDLGDAPAGAPESIFNTTLADAHTLLARLRGMLIGDPGADAELAQIVSALG